MERESLEVVTRFAAVIVAQYLTGNENKIMKIIITTIIIQWNVNIMKDYGTGKICLLYGVCYIEVPP